jgi:hypothetical protein
MSSPFGTVLRNGAVSLAGRLGSGFMLRRMAGVAEWNPPVATDKGYDRFLL